MGAFDDELATLREGEKLDDGLPAPIDWDALFARENEIDWLVDDVWPAGRQLHIFAARKTGKSLLMLWMAANLAAGRDPFSGQAREHVRIAYLDYEMTEDDLLERVEEMGFMPDDLRGRLFYYLWPTIPALDTYDGGQALMRLLQRDEAAAVILDTMSRVVGGEENSADTYRDFFIYTGMRLKSAGISLARLDHEGHEAGRSRGSSAKADDVDVIWRLERTDDGLALIKKAARMSWIPERIDLAQAEPLGFKRTSDSWPAGTAAKAAELDEIGVPLDATRRQARQLLVSAGRPAGRNDVLSKALKFRRVESGTKLGTTILAPSGTPSGTTGTKSHLAGGTKVGTIGDQPPGQVGTGPPLLRGDRPQPNPTEAETEDPW